MRDIYKKLIKIISQATATKALSNIDDAIKLKNNIMNMPASEHVQAEELMRKVYDVARDCDTIRGVGITFRSDKQWCTDYDEIQNILVLYHNVFSYMNSTDTIEEIQGDILRWGRELPGLPVLKYVDFATAEAELKERPDLVAKYVEFKKNVEFIIQRDIDNQAALKQKKKSKHVHQLKRNHQPEYMIEGCAYQELLAI